MGWHEVGRQRSGVDADIIGAREEAIEEVGAVGSRGDRWFVAVPISVPIVVEEENDAPDPVLAGVDDAIAIHVVPDRVPDGGISAEAEVGFGFGGIAAVEGDHVLPVHDGIRVAGDGGTVRVGRGVDGDGILTVKQVADEVSTIGTGNGTGFRFGIEVAVVVEIEVDADTADGKFGGILGTVAIGIVPDVVADAA